MESPPRGKNGWNLTPETFAKFLAFLDSDPARAGELYEKLRRKLIRIFEWRGSTRPEEFADETLNRLARKIDEGEVIRNLSSYAGGMARLVWLESLKESEREQGALEVLRLLNSEVVPDDHARGVCFETCLENLSSENRALILDYYREEKKAKIELRKELAKRMGLPLNALRIRACRIRAQLETCVSDCLRKSEE